ncbi:MAG: hypothetical protein QOI88_3838, partial [Gammaproteobacteria bacterium]|nr:hypothetical protein [Gammaproteobacteria bacterium]
DYPDQREKRISGSKNFRSPPQKDFCNTIGHFRTSSRVLVMSAPPLLADIVGPATQVRKCHKQTSSN